LERKFFALRPRDCHSLAAANTSSGASSAAKFETMEDAEPELRPVGTTWWEAGTSLFFISATLPNPFGCAAGRADAPAIFDAGFFD